MYARKYKGQIVWNACTWFPEMGTILRGGGQYTLDPEITILYQKALCKVPKICNINFWIEITPPLHPPFQKFIRFGSVTRPLSSFDRTDLLIDLIVVIIHTSIFWSTSSLSSLDRTFPPHRCNLTLTLLIPIIATHNYRSPILTTKIGTL